MPLHAHLVPDYIYTKQQLTAVWAFQPYLLHCPKGSRVALGGRTRAINILLSLQRHMNADHAMARSAWKFTVRMTMQRHRHNTYRARITDKILDMFQVCMNTP